MATPPLAGQIIRASDAFNMQTFTPVYTNYTIGAGAVNEGWYQEIGELVMWGFRTQLGTAPAGAGASGVLVDLPVPAWTGGGNSLQAAAGSFVVRDASPLLNYIGTMSIFASTGLQVSFSLGSSTTRMNGTNPITPAVDDVISGSGVYRAA